MFRAYCWRVGVMVSLELGESCPECGSPNHEPYTSDDCGNFISCQNPFRNTSMASHGHPCNLPIGHPGSCMCWPCDKPKEDVIRDEILDS